MSEDEYEAIAAHSVSAGRFELTADGRVIGPGSDEYDLEPGVTADNFVEWVERTFGDDADDF